MILFTIFCICSIILIVVLAIRSVKQDKQIRIFKEKYNDLENEINRVLWNYSVTSFGESMRDYAMKQLIAGKFYCNKNGEAYLIINTDTGGTKSLWKEENGKFHLMKKENMDMVENGLVSLGIHGSAKDALIDKFNNMERIMPELVDCNSYTFYYHYTWGYRDYPKNKDFGLKIRGFEIK